MTKSPKPKVGQVWYDPRLDEILWLEEIAFPGEYYPMYFFRTWSLNSARCVLRWQGEGQRLVYLGLGD